MQEFPIRRSRWALPFLVPLAPGRLVARVGDGHLEVRMGLLGRARVPLAAIARLGTMRWPWWGGVGVRIARGLVAFVGASGPIVVIDLVEPLPVRAPLRWRARTIGVGVEQPDALIAAIAAARGVEAPSAGPAG